jgi:beta-glucosidase/6-phospho-beta-glucosidase/beta-galactosidase
MGLSSFFLGGFECSSHRRYDGRRLDLTESTGHATFAARDYQLLRDHGLRVARDGVRWHLVEHESERYDWSSFTPMLEAASDAGVDVIWDLCHYGWPDHLDVWAEDFPQHFARFAAACARLIGSRTRAAPKICAVNEISFWAWAGGDVASINPLARGRGHALKKQLIRMAVEATRAIKDVEPGAVFFCSEPVINVPAASDDRRDPARVFHEAQYEALDMLLGRKAPELGGFEDAIDFVGVNFYPDNQWRFRGPTIPFGHNGYRPFRDMLAEVWRRYGKPIVITETGAEGSARAAWLHYVCDEVRHAQDDGVEVAGLCLYPIIDYPGWDNDRHCPVGLFSRPDRDGRREAHQPLAIELRRQQDIFAKCSKPPMSLRAVRI